VFGVDCKWRDTTESTHPSLDLIQISSGSICVLLQVGSWTQSSLSLNSFFGGNHLKLLDNPFGRNGALHRLLRFGVPGFMNIKIISDGQPHQQSIRATCNSLLSWKAPSMPQLADWSAEYTADQTRYAATEAWLYLKLWSHLQQPER
jgi:ribonuclease D